MTIKPNNKEVTTSTDERLNELSRWSELFGRFMGIERATYRDGRPENDGEHTLHTMFFAIAYTAKYHPEYDPAEVALLILIHDLDEIYTGDTNSLTADDDTMLLKEADEEQSRQRLRMDLIDSPYILQLLERYWKQEEKITRYVRTIEKLDPSLSHLQDNGQALQEMGIRDLDSFNEHESIAVERMARYGEEVAPDVLALRRQLGQHVARITFSDKDDDSR